MNLSLRLLIIILSLIACSVRAEDQGALEVISRQVDEQGTLLKELSAQVKTIESEIAKQNTEIKKMRGQESALLSEIKLNQDSQSRLRADIALADQRIHDFKVKASKRIRAMYVSSGQTAYQELLFSAGENFERYAVYLKRISASENRSIEALRSSIRESQVKSDKLALSVVEQGKLAGKLSKERTNLEAKVRDSQKSKADLAEREKGVRESLAALQAQALRLETVVASYTGAEEDKPRPAKPQAKEERTIEKGPFVGVGLFRLKGSLALPIKGQVLRRFGKSAVKDFPDMVMSKGIEYRASAGTEVRAIAPAQVIFVGRLPGYGSVVILDHGERYYSLYGRLDQVNVAKGNILEKSQVLALTGPADEKGRAFYFEVRKNGNPVNPQDYFKRL